MVTSVHFPIDRAGVIAFLRLAANF